MGGSASHQLWRPHKLQPDFGILRMQCVPHFLCSTDNSASVQAENTGLVKHAALYYQHGTQVFRTAFAIPGSRGMGTHAHVRPALLGMAKRAARPTLFGTATSATALLGSTGRALDAACLTQSGRDLPLLGTASMCPR
jgi:hypothetical protein